MSLYADFEHTFLLIFFILLQLLRVFSDHRSAIVGRCCSLSFCKAERTREGSRRVLRWAMDS